MRILVGTLYTIENEFAACVEAIRGQTHLEWEHFVVQNLPNAVAHRTLYQRFTDSAADFQLFLKVDADMVIARPDYFARLVETFERDDQLDMLEVAVHDFFTDRLILGMNAFRSRARWPALEAGLFVDAAPTNLRRSAKDWTTLAPSAVHCKDPSEFQAFHFGVHKGLKSREAAQSRQATRLLRHWENIERTWEHACRSFDRRLLLACVGAELALRGELAPSDIDFDSAHTRAAFQRVAGLPDASLRRLLRRERVANRWLRPSRWRAWQLRSSARDFVRRRLEAVT